MGLLNTGHHGLVHGTTRKNSGSLQRGTTALGGLNGALAVNGITERVNNATKECRADWNIDDPASALDGVALFDETVVTENRDTDIVGQPCLSSRMLGSMVEIWVNLERLPYNSCAPLQGRCPTTHVLRVPDGQPLVINKLSTQITSNGTCPQMDLCRMSGIYLRL
jgi:hypothetical protein